MMRTLICLFTILLSQVSSLGQLTWSLAGGNENWPSAKRDAIIAAMNEAVAIYNANGYFPKTLWANYNSGVPTAQASYSGWIDFGGSIGTRVALHEISHTLGVGQVTAWNTNRSGNTWTGNFAINRAKLFNGPSTTVGADSMHFWPYGLNYDSEDGTNNRARHVKMVSALRRDMGIVTDSDGDGIPNDWEMFYFGNLSQNATGDADGDGVNNLAEYNADTHPAAASFQWTGVSSSDWTAPGNWSTPPAPKTGTYYARLNVNNSNNSPLIHDTSHGSTTFRPADRGLVIGSGPLGSGAMILSGGSFSTLGASGPDVIGNSPGNTGTLTLDGGSFTSSELQLGVTGQGTGIINLNQGTANIGTLAFRFGTGGSGTVNLNAATLITKGILRSGTGVGTLILNGGILRATASSNAFIDNLTNTFIRLGGITIDTENFDLTIPQVLRRDPSFPDGGLTKTGTGILTLSQANTYTGPTTVSTGILIPESPNSISNNTTVTADATLALTGSSSHPVTQTLTLSGTGQKTPTSRTPAVQRGSLQSLAGHTIWNGPLTIATTNTRIGVQDGASLRLNGAISEASPATSVIFRAGMNPGDDIILGAPGAWTGSSIIYSSSAQGGLLRLAGSNLLPQASPLLLAGNGVAGRLDLNGFHQTVAGLSNATGGSSSIGIGIITNDGSSPSILTVAPSTNHTFLGRIEDGSQPIHLIKSGPASQIFTAAQTYSGNTTINSGTLRLDQIYLADASEISIISGAKLHLNFTGTDTVATLTLAGTRMPPGTYNSSTHPSYFLGTGSLSIPINFTNWLQLHADINDAAQAPEADPDADGLANLAEYALGTPPNAPQIHPISLTSLPAQNELQALQLRFDRLPNRADITITVEASSTLRDWTPIARSTGGSAFIPLLSSTQCAELPTNSERVQVTITDAPPNPAAVRFLRVVVARP